MPKSSSLLPREHGAYAQLAFPLVTGLTLSMPGVATVALGGAAVAFFLANEPVAILLGTRGKRLQEQAGGRAARRAALLLLLGAALGALGVWRGGSAVWPEIVYPLGAAALLVPTVLAEKQKTIPGEILVVTAFATLLLPMAVASGVSPTRAFLAAAVWWLSFVLGTLEVHAIKARLKKTAGDQWTLWGSPLAATLTLAASLALALGWGSPLLSQAAWAGEAQRLLPGAAAALIPAALAVLVVSLLRVHPRHLKRVGWTLVVANTLTLILLLQG